ncbi:MAG: protein kinase, partial [Planctomycetes bacterium]|nr:protein kinase [Planctomycetota bacterium]
MIHPDVMHPDSEKLQQYAEHAEGLGLDEAAGIEEHLKNCGRCLQAPGLRPFSTEHSAFNIVGLLGRGGMGAVYKAENKMSKKVYALKIIHKKRLANEEAVKRFFSEIETIAKLKHANIVPLHHADVFDGVPFFTMEYVEGTNLQDLVCIAPVGTGVCLRGSSRQYSRGGTPMTRQRRHYPPEQKVAALRLHFV